MRARPSERVIGWLDKHPATSLFISAITRAEIELGVHLLPDGSKKRQVQHAASQMFDEFEGRCLPFEGSAAIHYGQLVANRQKVGRPISVEDAQISAIALTHGMVLATRNTKDFVFVEGLELINPWEQEKAI